MRRNKVHFREAKRLKALDLMQTDQAPLRRKSFKINTDQLNKDGILTKKVTFGRKC